MPVFGNYLSCSLDYHFSPATSKFELLSLLTWANAVTSLKVSVLMIAARGTLRKQRLHHIPPLPRSSRGSSFTQNETQNFCSGYCALQDLVLWPLDLISGHYPLLMVSATMVSLLNTYLLFPQIAAGLSSSLSSFYSNRISSEWSPSPLPSHLSPCVCFPP